VIRLRLELAELLLLTPLRAGPCLRIYSPQAGRDRSLWRHSRTVAGVPCASAGTRASDSAISRAGVPGLLDLWCCGTSTLPDLFDVLVGFTFRK